MSCLVVCTGTYPRCVADKKFGPTALATPANAITVVRMLGSTALTVLILARIADWALVLFLVLALSDNIDGLLARWQGTTRSGAFLDPLADKVLVAGSLFALAWWGTVAWWIFALIVTREVAVSGFRTYALRRGAAVPASWWGKVKTLITLLGIGILLIPGPGLHGAGTVILWIAVVLTWVSAVDYFARARRLILEGQIDEGLADAS